MIKIWIRIKKKDLQSGFANKDKDNDNVNDNVIDNAIDIYNLGTCFADDNNDNNNDNKNDNDNVNDNNKDNDNNDDQGTCFADDNFIYLFDEKHQRSKSNSNSISNSIINSPTNNISVNVNEDLKSWLNDDDIITEAAFPDNFRCIISGPSECGKTFLLKKLILASIYFDKLYIIGPTGDQYNGLEKINDKADIEFIKDIKDLQSPDQLPKDLKKLMIFDDVRTREPVINEYFCRGRHNNCNMIYLNQNLFSLWIGRVLERIAIYLNHLNKEVKS